MRSTIITWWFTVSIIIQQLGWGLEAATQHLAAPHAVLIELLDPAPPAVLRIQYEQPCNNQAKTMGFSIVSEQ